METVELTFVKDRDTKNTARFREVPVGRAAVVGTLYIQKAVAAGVEAVRVRIESISERVGSKEAL